MEQAMHDMERATCEGGREKPQRGKNEQAVKIGLCLLGSSIPLLALGALKGLRTFTSSSLDPSRCNRPGIPNVSPVAVKVAHDLERCGG